MPFMPNTEVPTSLRKPASRDIRTVSHTLDAQLAERLQLFGFETRISESAVIEHALQTFFESGAESELATKLRAAGYGLRRKTA